MHIRAALLWEADGEPHREDVLISDAQSCAGERHIDVVDMMGRRRRRLSPDRVAKGSVLLLPPDARDEDLTALRREGFDARRTTFQVIGPHAQISEFFRALAHLHPFVVIAGEGALKLRAELGGDEQTGRWLQDLAAEIGHPIAINLPDHDGTKTFFVQTPSWSEERFRGWVAGHMAEVEAVFGEGEVIGITAPDDDNPFSETRWEAAKATSREAAIAFAEAELAANNERLIRHLRGQIVRFYHPRIDTWEDRFIVRAAQARIEGRTDIGRATVARLRMNDEQQITARCI